MIAKGVNVRVGKIGVMAPAAAHRIVVIGGHFDDRRVRAAKAAARERQRLPRRVAAPESAGIFRVDVHVRRVAVVITEAVRAAKAGMAAARVISTAVTVDTAVAGPRNAARMIVLITA